MEQLPNPEALELLDTMRGKMLMLYPSIDSASDELMRQEQAIGSFAIGFSLRHQYRELWDDWEELSKMVGLESFHDGATVLLPLPPGT
jgi:hypothetical protein